MSLDVYLEMKGAHRQVSTEGIFIRENGQTREITREEWGSRHPDSEPMVAMRDDASDYVFSANITHNLGGMADEAGIYKHLWRPDEIGITKAKELIEPLRAGLLLMRAEPERFKKHNPSNGWGSYEMFLPWIDAYIAACEAYPEADVSVSR